MTIDLKALSSKLKRYREQLEETIEETSNATGIPKDRLHEIEEGETQPSGDEILILSDHYQCDYKFFISNERTAPFEQTENLYRAYKEEFSKQDRRAVQEFLYLCETEEFLFLALERHSESFSFKSSGTYYKKHAEQGASELRKKFGYGDDTLNLDIYADLRKIGVHLFRRKLENSAISGLFVRHPTAGNCVLINYSEDVYRQRFSAAHELGHVIFDTDQQASVSLDKDQKKLLTEIRANRFASCYLMPPKLLRKLSDPQEWGEAETLTWANKLRVSCEALAIALREAKLINNVGYDRIRNFRVKREAKIDSELPETLSPSEYNRKKILLERGLSNAYVKLCFDAHYEGKISRGRLAEAILTTEEEII